MSTDSKPPKRHRWFVGLLALVLLSLLSLVIWNLSRPANDPRVEAIRAKGYPVTIKDLDDAYKRPPDAENAAFLYTNAFAGFLFTSNLLDSYTGNNWLPVRRKTTDEWTRTEFEEILATNKETMDLLYAASTRPISRYPIDLKEGAFTLMPHLARVKLATTTLATQAMFKAEEGKTDDAVRAFGAAGKVADSVSEEPVLISQLVRYASWNILCHRLERALGAANWTDKQLQELQEIVARGEKPGSVALGLVGERTGSLAFFSDPKFQKLLFVGPASSGSTGSAGTGERLRAQLGVGALKIIGLFSKDKAFFLDTMSNSIWAAELPYPQRWSQSQSLPPPIPSSRLYIFSRMLLPSLSKAVTKDAEHTARIRVARVALALERFRLAHNDSLPDELPKIGPLDLTRIPTDPFDGQPLRYKKLGGAGYVIYSIGADGVDNGGAEYSSGTTSGYDITFIVEKMTTAEK